jgi:metallophosphoesterase (TIGR00282 family)
MRVLVIGDVCGEPGRRAVRELLPDLVDAHDADVVIANGENATRGLGIGARHAQQLLAAGVDGITLGNHSFRQRDIFPMLNEHDRIIRPANMAHRAPGRGLMFVPITRGDAAGSELAVINLMGTLYLDTPHSPFEMVDELIDQARERTPMVLIDLHAEATSEKVAMAHHVDGRVSAIVGTHTHVQTSDARVLAAGTAFITDLGMTGPHDSVIGVRKEIIIKRFITGIGERFETAFGGTQLEGAVIDIDQGSGHATSISSLRVPLPSEDGV